MHRIPRHRASGVPPNEAVIPGSCNQRAALRGYRAIPLRASGALPLACRKMIYPKEEKDLVRNPRMNRMEALIERRLETRRSTASVCVERILEDARKHGTKIRVIGSLAKRNFHLHSDVDLLVGGPIDPARRLFVERLVAAHMRGTGIPYDLIFEADMTIERIQELLPPGLLKIVTEDCSRRTGAAAARSLFRPAFSGPSLRSSLCLTSHRS